MKTFSAVVAIAALGFGAANVSANGNGNTSSNSGASAPHHGSATATTVAPLFNGIPHYYGTMPYRPAVSYRNGSRTLNYPAVGVSTLRHPIHSAGSNFNNAYALQRGGVSHPLSGFNTGGKTHLDPKYLRVSEIGTEMSPAFHRHD
jgi:hypothetical protein